MGNTLAMIALGSNLGDRRATLDRAIDDLAASRGAVVRGVSAYHETSPVGGPGGQGAFLNAAASLETTLDAFALHRLLIEVELRAGRVRDIRWDARTLDLDLILFGDQILDEPDLIVPHPRFAVRRFVLAPMAELSPEVIDPLTGKTVEDLLSNLDRRPSYVAIDGLPGSGLPRRIAQRVSDVLGGLVQSRREPRTPEHEGDPPTRFDQLTSSKVELQKTRDLSWSMPGDRWIVSDYSVDLDLLRLGSVTARLRAEQPRSSRVHEKTRRLGEESLIRPEAVTPTFCVAIGFRDWGWSLPDLENAINVPLLIPDARDEDGLVSEIVAACQATRP
jgi:2-amino-4-hydroxy-6-hydroxymethyldihydropteridine diphosphokinase